MSRSRLPELTEIQEQKFGSLIEVIRTGNLLRFRDAREDMERRGEVLSKEDLEFLQEYTNKFIKRYQENIKDRNVYDGALQIRRSIEEKLQMAIEGIESPVVAAVTHVSLPPLAARYVQNRGEEVPRRRFSANPRNAGGQESGINFLRRATPTSGVLGAKKLFEEFKENIISGNLRGILENKDIRGIITAISKKRDAGLSQGMIKELRKIAEENYKPLSLDVSDSRFLILEMLNGVIPEEINHFFEKPKPEMVAQTPRGAITPGAGSNVDREVVRRRAASADFRLPSL